MTSLVWRRLHILKPGMTRAGVTSMTKLRISSPLQVRNALDQMMGSDRRLYTTSLTRNASSTVALPVKEKEERRKVAKRAVKTQEDLILEKMLYKLDLDMRNTGRVLNHELEKVVKSIEESGSCTANQALLVLRCCGEVLVDRARQDRAKLLDRYMQVLKKNGVNLDASHYNTILRVHLENQTCVSAPDFLAEMEAAGIAPNRVTFQHLLSLYCMEGNIVGATTILEHMKAQNMPISEAVLISLLKCHCANNDTESVAATLELMTSSGLSLGVDTFSAMASSYGRAGNWSKVEEVFNKAVKEDVKLDDGHILSIILACSEGGLHAEADSLVSKLQKKRGFFQKARNHLPQIATSGNVSTAVDLYLSMRGDKDDRDQKGYFMVASITRSGQSMEVVLNAVMKMEKAGYTNSVQTLVKEAAYNWTNQKVLELKESLKNHGQEVMNWDKALIFKYLGNLWQDDRDVDRMLDCINNLHTLGISVPFNFIEQDLLPAMIHLEHELPTQLKKRLLARCPGISWDLADGMILSNLYKINTVEGVSAATGFFLYNPFLGFTHPNKWNLRLAWAYLNTDTLEDLITTLFINSRDKPLGQTPAQTAVDLFKVLEYILENAPRSDPETMLTPVLKELVRHHIGVPEKVVMALRKAVKSDETKDLLDKARVEWDNREAYWTDENVSRFLNQRKKMHQEIKIPDTREAMEKIQAVLAGRGDASPSLSGNLINAYVKEGLVDKAIELMKYTQEKKPEFGLSQTNVEAIVKGLILKERVQEALDILEQELEKDRKLFLRTFITCLQGLAKDGKDQKVLDMINNCNKDNFLEESVSDSTGALLSVYSRKGDVKMTQDVFHALSTTKLAISHHHQNLNPLVEVHMSNGDLKGAVSEYKRIAKEYKKLLYKYELTCRLIEQEEVDAMQEVLDTSIELIGEQRSLYDLAFSFLTMGRRAQAKKLLETPGLRYSEESFMLQCNKLVQDKQLEMLEDLITFSKSIFGCDRNLLYQHLVDAYKEDPDKVSNIWLQIQEEGFVPSDSLKVQIAEAFKAGGITVPFEEETAEKSVKIENEVKSKPAKNSDTTRVDLVDEDVYKALEAKDFNAVTEIVMDSFEKGNTSPTCRKRVISELTKEDKIEEASKVAIKVAQEIKNPKAIRFKELYNNIVDKLDDAKKEEFLSSLSPALVKMLKVSRKKEEQTRTNKDTADTASNIETNKGTAADTAANIDKFAGDSIVMEAFKQNNITDLLEGMTNLRVSRGCRDKILKEMIAGNKVDDAAKIIIASNKLNSDHRKGKLLGHVCDIIKKWEEAGTVNKTIEFLKQINQSVRKSIKGDVWVKAGLARTDPTGYIALLKEESDKPGKWLVSSDVLAESVETSPALLSTLESLAAENFVPAHVLLSKLSIVRQDSEQFEKHIRHCPSTIQLLKLGGIYDKIDTTEKMEMVVEVLKRNNAEKEVLETVANKFKLHSEKTPETKL